MGCAALYPSYAGSRQRYTVVFKEFQLLDGRFGHIERSNLMST